MSSQPHLQHQTAIAIRDFDTLPDAAHVRLPVVQMLYACSDETVRKRVISGEIPAPRKFGQRMTVWNVGELRRALAA